MTWYVASIIMSIKTLEQPQSQIPVYENFVLIEAETSTEALEKAEVIGRNEAFYNNDMTLDNKAAKMVYEGLRKLINISNPEPFDLDHDRPVSGTELTYSQYILENNEQMKDLVDGGELTLRYIE